MYNPPQTVFSVHVRRSHACLMKFTFYILSHFMLDSYSFAFFAIEKCLCLIHVCQSFICKGHWSQVKYLPIFAAWSCFTIQNHWWNFLTEDALEWVRNMCISMSHKNIIKTACLTFWTTYDFPEFSLNTRDSLQYWPWSEVY